MKSITQLQIEYCERTKSIQFPENVEKAIEKDYPKNPDLYTDSLFRKIKIMSLICPDIDPEELIEEAKKLSKESKNSNPCSTDIYSQSDGSKEVNNNERD
ncbi:hypothetical protein ACUNV4_29460 [Granulosicoccus sp. 3-233]|uniref:hypothetical protein n=1 Tax=Granulosicoccus sp. 3-233 TaxID=3417969 RepID=UPI003D34B17D